MLNFKEEQTYICTKSDRPWFTTGEEYTVILDSRGTALIIDNDGDGWSSRALAACNNEFKLKETQAKAVDRKYTPFEVTKVIIKAYQLYDNDSQRLAYIKGYFAK